MTVQISGTVGMQLPSTGGGIEEEVDPLALKVANDLSDLNDAGTARTNLGLGGLATGDDAADVSYAAGGGAVGHWVTIGGDSPAEVSEAIDELAVFLSSIDASQVDYFHNDGSDWNGEHDQVNEALDELVDRVQTLEGLGHPVRASSTLPAPNLGDWTDANTIGWADTAATTAENTDGIYLQAPDAARTGTVGIALASLGAGPWAMAFDFGQNDSGNASEHRIGIGLYDPVAGRLGAVAWSQVGNASLFLSQIDDNTNVWEGSTLSTGNLTKPQISTSVRVYLAMDASNNLTLYYADGAGVPRVADALAGAFDDSSRIVFFHNVAGSYAVADGIEGLLAGMASIDNVPGYR